jgi:hypothetical protein
MPTAKQITKANDKLDETLDILLNKDQKLIEKSIERLENKIINLFNSLPVNDDGTMRLQRSLKSAQQVHSEIIKAATLEYGSTVESTVVGFSEVEKAIKTRFSALTVPLKYTSVDREMFRALKKQMVYEMKTLGVTATQEIASGMYDMVLTGTKFSDLVDIAKNSLTGIKTKAGKPLSSYASQQIHDSLMGYYSQIEQVKAKDAGIDTYLYYGNLMSSSRAFCIARAGRVFTRKQIDSWNKCRWQGKKPGSVFINRGGYNCRHSFMAVRKSWVKESKIKTETYWTQPGMEMPDKLKKEVIAEEKKLTSYSSKPTKKEQK